MSEHKWSAEYYAGAADAFAREASAIPDFTDRAAQFAMAAERIRTLEAEVARLRWLLRQVTDDLNEWICNEYRPDHPMTPDNASKFQRDMMLVYAAREALAGEEK